jgi:TonB-linked SusC/RagA family outer membrane protein
MDSFHLPAVRRQKNYFINKLLIMKYNTTLQKLSLAFFWQLFLVGFLSINLQAQEKLQVAGKVTMADNSSLPGVSIVIKGTTIGTVSDSNGSYALEASTNDLLIFSFIGMETKEVAINGKTIIDIIMNEDVQTLSEVVVVGYGTVQKSHLTGSVAKVEGTAIRQIPVARIDDALTGQFAGVNIQQTNPAAGAAPKINVRGYGSITGSTDPLIVLDGIVVGSDYLASINSNDVESIEVLKDASSAAIYGSRGANGVIIVTSKKGKEGPTKFSYNGYVGVKSVPPSGVLSTVDSWSDFVRANNNGELNDQMKVATQLGTSTDWEKVMMDGGVINSHSISAMGGNANTKFNASLNYLNDEGVLLTDNFQSTNFRLNLNTKVNERVEFGIMLNPSFTKQKLFPMGLQDAIRQSPWLPIRLDEHTIQYVNRLNYSGAYANAQVGDYAVERMFDNYDLVAGMPVASGGTSMVPTGNTNPYAMVVERDNNKNDTKVFANTYLKINLFDGLSFRTSIGGDFRYTETKNWTGTKATPTGAGGTQSTFGTNSQMHVVTESMFNYNKVISNHSINAVLGYAFESWNAHFSNITGVGYQADNIHTIATTNVGSGGASTSETKETLISYLGRVNYAYADKYLLSVSARTDGSSKFGPNNKFGFFPAASVGWRLSEEGFLKGNNTITDLKVRMSYGVTGSNSGIGTYAHLGIMNPVGAVFNGATVTAYNQANISNPDLQWEKLVEINPGIDAQFYSGRFGISLDYYNRRSKDLLLYQPVQSTTGFTTSLVNLGEVENAGFEVELNSQNISSGSFSWSTSAILTKNKNTLISMPGANGLISTVDPKRPTEWIALEGNPISSFYGYVAGAEIGPQFINNPYYPIGANAQDIYIKDINNDGVIDTKDRTILGSPYPKFIWSLTNTLKYSNFDLSFMFQGSHGAKVRNIDPQYLNNQFSANMDFNSSFTDGALVNQKIFTSDQIMSAEYIALRNLNLGYSLPMSSLSKVGLTKVRFFASAQNLLYIMGKGYKGYNPEGVYDSDGFGTASPLTYGYQRGVSPIYRTMSLGLNLEF